MEVSKSLKEDGDVLSVGNIFSVGMDEYWKLRQVGTGEVHIKLGETLHLDVPDPNCPEDTDNNLPSEAFTLQKAKDKPDKVLKQLMMDFELQLEDEVITTVDQDVVEEALNKAISSREAEIDMVLSMLNPSTSLVALASMEGIDIFPQAANRVVNDIKSAVAPAGYLRKAKALIVLDEKQETNLEILQDFTFTPEIEVVPARAAAPVVAAPAMVVSDREEVSETWTRGEGRRLRPRRTSRR